MSKQIMIIAEVDSENEVITMNRYERFMCVGLDDGDEMACRIVNKMDTNEIFNGAVMFMKVLIDNKEDCSECDPVNEVEKELPDLVEMLLKNIKKGSGI